MFMKNFLNKFLGIFKNNKNTAIYTIQELNALRQKKKKINLAKKSRAYILELNKKQRIWLERNTRNSKKVS